MTISTRQTIKDFDGNDIPSLSDPAKPLTVGSAIMTALVQSYQDEQGLGGEEKVKRFKLAERFLGDKVDLTNQEAAEVERLVAKCWGVLVVGRLAAVLARPA